MGKSPNSCFKIITCRADPADVDDDLSPPESKQSSSDKRRWSFRKRSARHLTPSSTLISESQVVGFGKERDATAEKFHPAKDSSDPEKSSTREQANVLAPFASPIVNPEKTSSLEEASETTPLPSAIVNSDGNPVIQLVKESEHLSSAIHKSEESITLDHAEVASAVDANLQEKYAVVIQVAARRFLAQRELHRLKNVVKLQAAVRGHLVRKQAIGTLRCVQAIVKLQILVRARRARQLEKCTGVETNNEESEAHLVKRNSDLISNQINPTFRKLLSNGFARQLLESTSKTRQIHISCDPLRHDSAWQWLERWMAVTSSRVGQQQELGCSREHQGDKEDGSRFHEELDVNPIVGHSSSSDLKLSPDNSVAAESQEDFKTANSGNFESQAPSIVSDQCFSFSTELEKEHPQGEEHIGMGEENFTQTIRDKETSEGVSQSAHSNHPIHTSLVKDNLMHITKAAASDPVETEKKFDVGSRKNRNPLFAAVQAKFEELSSAPKPNRSVSIPRDAGVESKSDHSQVVSVTNSKDFNSIGNLTTRNPLLHVASSECGTEISISSTLDSPDRSENDGGEIVLEFDTSRKGTHNVNSGATEASNLENIKAESNTLLATSVEFNGQPGNRDDENAANSITAVDPAEAEQPSAEAITSGNWNQQENLKAQAFRSSPDGSPRNQAIVPESNGTPSSQVSVQSKTGKSQNNNPARKPKSKSGTNRSLSNRKNDADERSSIEHLPKEAKSATRCSFGMAKTDHTDNEPRHSSSNSLPSYMQATESARAKAHGSVSLKSSPDVHDKENNVKKRHSLPIEDEKQGSSPRVQRSASQTQQSSKRNSNNSPHSSAEKRWQR